MRRTLALLASTALLLPAAVLAAPAEAATATTSDTVKNCSKTRHGVTVRIKMRDNGDFTRIRVSHPRGKGNFAEPRLKWVAGGVSRSSTPPPDEQGRSISGISLDREHRLKPSFRSISVADGYSTTGVSARFRLDNGKTIRLSCSLP